MGFPIISKYVAIAKLEEEVLVFSAQKYCPWRAIGLPLGKGPVGVVHLQVISRDVCDQFL